MIAVTIPTPPCSRFMHSLRSRGVLILLSGVVAFPGCALRAQQTLGASGGCPLVSAWPDSLDAPVFLELTAPNLVGLRKRDAIREREKATLLVLQELRSAFVAPVRVALTVGRHTALAMPVGPDDVAVPELAARVRFTLFADGRTQDVRLTAQSGAPALDSALVDGVGRATKLGALSGLASQLGGDSLVAEIATTVGRQGIKPNIPLLRIRLPRYPISRMVILPPLPSPAYPPAAMQRGLMDQVTLRFVIDTLGKVDIESLSVKQSPTRDPVARAR